MFFLNLGYKWAIQQGAMPHGVVFNASGLDCQGLLARGVEGLPGSTYIDPQLYLLSLLPETAAKTCCKLATYPWFPIDVPEAGEGELKRGDILDAILKSIERTWPKHTNFKAEDIREIVKEAIEFQQTFDLAGIILPSILTDSPLADLTTEMEWIDVGLELSRGEDKPILGTFAISEICLSQEDPKDNDVLNIAIDHFTAREELDGVYLVVEQSRNDSNRITQASVAKSILEFCYRVGSLAGKKILLNYVDTFGIVCLAAGADGFASGYFRKAKRLNYSDFESEFGIVYPKFYSHTTICDYLSARDLERLRDKRLLRLIDDDWTAASDSLRRALLGGAPVNSVPEWAETRNNYSQAVAHYIQKVRQVVDTVNALSIGERRQQVLDWLQDAERTVNYLNERFRDENLSDTGSHVGMWRAAFEWFINKTEG